MRATCVFLLLAAVAMSACGGDEDTASESQDSRNSVEETSANQESAGRSPKDVVATIEVEETEYELNPANPGVEDPGKVAFEVTNAGKITHSLEVEGPKGAQETDDIAPGKTATMTVDMSKPGKYKWYCPIADHAQQGMSGSVSIAYDKVNETDQPREEGEQGPGSDGHGGY